MGVWIEINLDNAYKLVEMSLPVWECGLKLMDKWIKYNPNPVTPCVGVWIEII